MRDRPPMSYSLRMESFNTLLQSNETERYESRPFPVGGYNWSLIVYPNGNRQDSGSGFISLYLAIDNSTLLSSHQEVFADLRFYVFKRTERNFFTVQDTDVWRYNIFKTMWGFPRVLPLDTFRNPSNGYLFNGDNCEFGVDVTVHSPFESSELFTVARNFPNPRFTWTIQRSPRWSEIRISLIRSRSEEGIVNPRGRSTGAGRAMSMYLILNANEKVRPNEKIYVRARLRVINQRIFSLLWTTIERPIDHWFTTPGLGWDTMSYVMGDVLIVEVEMEAISSTKYFPKTPSLLFLSCFVSSSHLRLHVPSYVNTLMTLTQIFSNGAGPNPNLGEANYEDKYQEISSRDYKVSASNAVKGLRDRPPSSYTLKMETLVVYPNGNKKDSGSGYLSLYVAIDNSTLVGAQQEVLADLRFYVFNNNERKYFTIQDTTVRRFNVFKTMWGFSQVLPVDTFKIRKTDTSTMEITEKLRPYEKVYVRAKLRVNQRKLNNVQRQLNSWYNRAVASWGSLIVYPNGYRQDSGSGFISLYVAIDNSTLVEAHQEVFADLRFYVFKNNERKNIQVNPSGRATREGRALSIGEWSRTKPNVGEVNYVDKLQEISSRDYKVSASNAVKGLRDRPPSSYTLKMESFNTLLKSNYAERYESRPFAVDNSTLVAAHQEVLADLRFYIFNNNERKYFTIQDTTVWRFNVFKTMWGFSQVLPVDTFKDPKNGYLYDGDHCEFGVDVIIPSIAENSELFSATEKFYNPTFTWTIRGFSTLLKDMYSSDVFTIGGRMYPNGRGEGEGKFLSMFLKLNGEEKLRPYEKVYVRAKLRVLNQSKLNNVQNQLDSWFSRAVPSWGFRKLISFDDLRDSSKGFLVNDMLMVQVEMEAVSSTNVFDGVLECCNAFDLDLGV
ncbi:hypothetical protein HID58_013757 [Brassica napus]|uniref:MATH domain-containing protein n=1 Tax=Brassica napus TaxID=3708 RepID=A0ABQ7XH23_BRANA|nr:hypothetical protein HID58_013757 [Brassica napus]